MLVKVVFEGQDGEKRVRCEISREALDDHFHGDNKDKLEVFRADRPIIERAARAKSLPAGRNPMGLFLSAPSIYSANTIAAASGLSVACQKRFLGSGKYRSHDAAAPICDTVRPSQVRNSPHS